MKGEYEDCLWGNAGQLGGDGGLPPKPLNTAKIGRGLYSFLPMTQANAQSYRHRKLYEGEKVVQMTGVF